MPRVFHSHRPPWYSAAVSQQVGKLAGVTVRPSFANDNYKFLWQNESALRSHPRAQNRLIPVRPPSPSLSPQIKLDAKSLRRAQMFNSQGAEIAFRASENEPEMERGSSRDRGMVRQYYDSHAAREMHQFSSPERVFRSAYHLVKPNMGLPYKPATPSSGRVPTPQRPSSGVTPRIAGAGAAAILKGTGAMSALPAIVHLARGGSLGSMVPQQPGKGVGPVVTYRDKKTGKTFKLGGSWS